MNKRNLLISSALVLAALLVVGGTMAWFTASSGPVTNKFTAGTVDIELHDVAGYDTDQNEIPFSENVFVANVNPGDDYMKIVYVENTGSKAVYVRVKLTPNWTGGLPNVVTIDAKDYIMADFPILEGWEYYEGWYYYTSPVAAGASTSNLIEEVIFAGKEMTNAYQGATFTLEVEAEAVQASHEAYKDEWDPALEDILTPYTP